jgi:hypothetical protein
VVLAVLDKGILVVPGRPRPSAQTLPAAVVVVLVVLVLLEFIHLLEALAEMVELDCQHSRVTLEFLHLMEQ